MMRATGILFMSKTPPTAMKAADGVFSLTLLAYDRLGPHKVEPWRLFAWLQEHQWIYRRAGGSGFTAYQARIQVGYLEHKVSTVERSDGSVKMVEQVLVTPKGLAKLAAELTMKVAA